MSSSAIQRLISELSRLPGVGPRSARRLALHILRNRQQRIPALISALGDALAEVKTCSTCFALDDTDPCSICTDTNRDGSHLCIVEDVADVWAMERSGAFKGRYHVLGGTLSAIDGRGPEALSVGPLLKRLEAGDIKEIILALSATVGGQTTAHYVAERMQGTGVRVTRLAQGIPMGGELDYLDDGTLSAALSARLPY